MKVSKILGHYDNAVYDMVFNIRIKEESLKPTEGTVDLAQLLGKTDLIPLPIVRAVIHDMLADIGNKTGKDLDTILKSISDVDKEYPVEFGEDKINYELR